MTPDTPPPRSAAERGPGTAAGRALLEIAGTEGQPTGVIRDAILAIEAEAEAPVPPAADVWQAGYEACWNRLKDAGRLLPSDGATAAVPLDERLADIEQRLKNCGQHIFTIREAIRAAGIDPNYRIAADRLSGSADKKCNCPEIGTSGSCPFHDATTVQP